MSIWKKPITPENLTAICEGNMAGFLGIRFIEVGEDFLKATMPASDRTRQPLGIIHGGANVVLAEGLASTAANCTLEDPNKRAVGLEINANHLRKVWEGIVTATARPIHLGRQTQVWQIKIEDEQGRPTCIARMTAAIIQMPASKG